MTTEPQRIAFFGATGDCAGYCLVHSLNAGYDCAALARTPSKLTASLKAKGVAPEALDRRLTITQGDIKDVEAVKRALLLDGKVVDMIVSGVGSAPKLQFSLWALVTLLDPTICQDAGRTILAALKELQSSSSKTGRSGEKKPLLVNVSTTGISPPGKPRDVPLLYAPLYYYFLHVPHEDKKLLERALAENVGLGEQGRVIRGFVNVKPTLLMDGEGLGLQAVREGRDDEPAVGYTIRRKDVGVWMFERLVDREVPEGWVNRSLSLTY